MIVRREPPRHPPNYLVSDLCLQPTPSMERLPVT